MSVEISDDDYEFCLAALEKLTSPISTEDEIAEAISLENEMKKRLEDYK
jgi:hypothetical protein